MTRPAHRRGSGGRVPIALLLAMLVGFGLGWAGALLYGAMLAPSPAAAAGPSPASAAPSPAAPPAPVSSAPASADVRPVGFARPTPTPAGLEITAVVTKMPGGVVLTVVAQNNGEKPIRVSTTELGPGKVTFRGAAVPMDMAARTKSLAPGEALVYPCRVRLPDMNSGEMAFTVAGVEVAGQAAGD